MIDIEEDDDVKNLYWVNTNGKLAPATKNLTPGTSFYQERLIKYKKIELRLWDPFRSKLAAILVKGYRPLPLGAGTKILYLGASTGTTVSHVSDLIEANGLVFAVELAPRVARELMINVVSRRNNIIPIIADARYPNQYRVVFKPIDMIYSDIAQADQTDIALLNADKYLERGGYFFVAIKARSINPLKQINKIIEEEVEKIKNHGFNIEAIYDLSPFDKDHGFVIATKL